MLDNIIQIIIFSSSCGAIWLLSRDKEWKAWGYLIGLIGQPLWIYDSLRHEQWGIFAVSLWFAYCYLAGTKNHLMPYLRGKNND